MDSGHLALELTFPITRHAVSSMIIAPKSLFQNYWIPEIIVHVQRDSCTKGDTEGESLLCMLLINHTYNKSGLFIWNIMIL